MFVETKTFAEQLSGTLAIAYEVSDSASPSFFAFFPGAPTPVARTPQRTRPPPVDDYIQIVLTKICGLTK